MFWGVCVNNTDTEYKYVELRSWFVLRPIFLGYLQSWFGNDVIY